MKVLYVPLLGPDGDDTGTRVEECKSWAEAGHTAEIVVSCVLNLEIQTGWRMCDVRMVMRHYLLFDYPEFDAFTASFGF